jgi:hypothetical protein
MTLDQKTNQIYLVTADFGPAPAPSAENKGRGGRGALLPDSFSILVVGK